MTERLRVGIPLSAGLFYVSSLSVVGPQSGPSQRYIITDFLIKMYAFPGNLSGSNLNRLRLRKKQLIKTLSSKSLSSF